MEPQSAITYSPTPLPIAYLLAQPCVMYGDAGREATGKGNFVFISLKIVT